MNIVERILQFIKSEGITRYKFYQITGLSNGFLDKNSNIGSDKCEIIISHFPKINVNWLLTGNGPMLNENIIDNNIQEPKVKYGKAPPGCQDCKEKDIKIKILEDNLITKDKYIALLEKEINRLNSTDNKG